MYLKRQYDPKSLKRWERKRRAAIKPRVEALVDAGLDETLAVNVAQQKYSDENGLPKITHVDVLRAGKAWRPSKKVIEQGVADGWLSIADGKMTIKTGPDDKDVTFAIKKAPGRKGNQYDCVREK